MHGDMALLMLLWEGRHNALLEPFQRSKHTFVGI